MPSSDVVSSGSRVKIAASDWNMMLKAGRDAREHSTAPGQVADSSYPMTIAKVRNIDTDDMPRFAAVGINSILIDPADNLAEFKRQPMFEVIVPVAGEHEDGFVILLEPLAAGPENEGSIGAAMMAGVGPCRITGANLFKRAEITSGQTYLTCDINGSAEILWAAPGSSERWAIVRIGEAVRLWEYVKRTGASDGEGEVGYIRYKDALGVWQNGEEVRANPVG